MGYWEEKQQYESELETKKFCGVCGKAIKENNIKGKCVSCQQVVCKSCGDFFKKKLICRDCLEGEQTRKCPKCYKDCILNKKEFGILDSKGKITIKCPSCKRKVIIEDYPILRRKKEDLRYAGVIPIWVVVLGFLFYVFPGLILLIIREIQLRHRGLRPPINTRGARYVNSKGEIKSLYERNTR